MTMVRVLLIEDDPLVQTSVASALRGRGYEVDFANDGEDGLSKIVERMPDIVVTDIVMPKMEGIETIQALKKSYPDLPVIAISGGGGYNTGLYLTMAHRFGADAILEKPFKIGALADLIASLGSPSSDSA